MFEILFFTLLTFSAVAAAVFSYVVVVGTVQINRNNDIGWFPIILYFLFISVALGAFDSGRDLTQGAYALLVTDSTGRSAWGVWSQRLCTVVILIVAFERIAATLLSKNRLPIFNWQLLFFVLYWTCTVASPSFFGKYPIFSYEYLYPLLIGVAGLVLSANESERVVIAARNATLIFIAAGFVLLPFKSGMVLEWSYTQGYIPGLPRMAGLSPHALQFGLIVQVAMLCLWVHPLEKRSLNLTAWLMCGVALLLAQSKTAWISFSLCAAVMVFIRNGSVVSKWIFDLKRPSQGVLVVLAWMFLVSLIAYLLVFSQFGNKLVEFLDTKEGSALLTLNGRDQIWRVAIDEWSQSPVWGYGPTFLNSAHRLSIGLPFATHGHNQFVDDLARAGLVGGVAMVIYSVFLFTQSIRFARVSCGLSIALFIVIFIRGISEVPLVMYGYSIEFTAHLLLLTVLHGAAKAVKRNPRSRNTLP